MYCFNTCISIKNAKLIESAWHLNHTLLNLFNLMGKKF